MTQYTTQYTTSTLLDTDTHIVIVIYLQNHMGGIVRLVTLRLSGLRVMSQIFYVLCLMFDQVRNGLCHTPHAHIDSDESVCYNYSVDKPVVRIANEMAGLPYFFPKTKSVYLIAMTWKSSTVRFELWLFDQFVRVCFNGLLST